MKYELIFIKNSYDKVTSSKYLSILSTLQKFNIDLSSVHYLDDYSSLDVLLNEDRRYLIFVDNNKYKNVFNYLKGKAERKNTYFQKGNMIIYLLSTSSNFYDTIKELKYVESEYLTFKLYGASMYDLQNFFLDKNINIELERSDLDINLKVPKAELEKGDKYGILRSFVGTFQKNIYAEQDCTLSEALHHAIKLRKVKISVAESFTGGALSSTITSIPGSSEYFVEGCVTYSEKAKKNRLSVSELTLMEDRAVSARTAYEMCAGLLMVDGVDFAISTTGLAGPDSDDSGFPVGLCYIAVGNKDKISVNKYNFVGTREDIIRVGVDTAMFHLIKVLRDL